MKGIIFQFRFPFVCWSLVEIDLYVSSYFSCQSRRREKAWACVLGFLYPLKGLLRSIIFSRARNIDGKLSYLCLGYISIIFESYILVRRVNSQSVKLDKHLPVLRRVINWRSYHMGYSFIKRLWTPRVLYTRPSFKNPESDENLLSFSGCWDVTVTLCEQAVFLWHSMTCLLPVALSFPQEARIFCASCTSSFPSSAVVGLALKWPHS